MTFQTFLTIKEALENEIRSADLKRETARAELQRCPEYSNFNMEPSEHYKTIERIFLNADSELERLYKAHEDLMDSPAC